MNRIKKMMMMRVGRIIAVANVGRNYTVKYVRYTVLNSKKKITQNPCLLFYFAAN